MAFRWWADDGPNIVAFDTFSSSPVMNKNNNNKVVIHVVGLPLTKLSGSAHDKPLVWLTVTTNVSNFISIIF